MGGNGMSADGSGKREAAIHMHGAWTRPAPNVVIPAPRPLLRKQALKCGSDDAHLTRQVHELPNNLDSQPFLAAGTEAFSDVCCFVGVSGSAVGLAARAFPRYSGS